MLMRYVQNLILEYYKSCCSVFAPFLASEDGLKEHHSAGYYSSLSDL